MGFLSSVLNIVGAVLLTHAVYSAHEHSLLPAHSTPSTSPSTSPSLTPRIDLPLDITLECLFSVLLLCVGVVLGSQDLRPIQWRVWAGKLEREGRKEPRTEDEKVVRANPYKALDERLGFLDIRGTRREFAEWVRDAGGEAK